MPKNRKKCYHHQKRIPKARKHKIYVIKLSFKPRLLYTFMYFNNHKKEKKLCKHMFKCYLAQLNFSDTCQNWRTRWQLSRTWRHLWTTPNLIWHNEFSISCPNPLGYLNLSLDSNTFQLPNDFLEFPNIWEKLFWYHISSVVPVM